jgi:hypothetical protein
MASRQIESHPNETPEGVMERVGRAVVFLLTPAVVAGALLLSIAVGLTRLTG